MFYIVLVVAICDVWHYKEMAVSKACREFLGVKQISLCIAAVCIHCATVKLFSDGIKCHLLHQQI